MRVKPGYKKTEVGVIPDDWDVKRIGDLGNVVRGGSPRPAGDPRYFNGSFIPWLTVAALTNVPDSQIPISDTLGHLTEQGASQSRTLDEGTVIIANSGATLGVAKVLGVRCCANDGIAAIINQRLGNKEFVCQYINTQTKYLRDVVAPGNGQPNLNTTLIREIPLPFPSTGEQGAIAGALGDVDALITALDRLVAKKRDLKQAAMQQLLSGQTRLPGFTKEWEVKRLEDVFRFLNTANSPRSDLSEFGEVGYIHYGDVHTTRSAFLDCSEGALPFILQSKVANVPFVEDGDVVMVDASEDCVGIGKCVEILGTQGRRVVAGLHTLLMRSDKEGIARGFGGYLQFSGSVRTAMVKLATGISVFGISKGSVRTIEVSLPPVAEQTAIAAVLSDMDAEIAALEQRLAKTRALKQGMMQELLTGRTRLV